MMISSLAHVLSLAFAIHAVPPDSQAGLADSARRAIDSAVEAGRMSDLSGALAFVERAASSQPSDKLLQHYYGYALYRIAVVTYGREGSGKARAYVQRAHDVLETLANDSTSAPLPETYALLSATYGLQIVTSRIQWMSGIRFGSTSSSWMDRAVAAGPNNPRVWMLRGIGAMNTPGAFGGGLDRAESYLRKAIELFPQSTPVGSDPAWGAAEVHAWLGQVLAKQHRIDAARAEYEAALAIQPRYGWVTEVLLPALEKAH